MAPASDTVFTLRQIPVDPVAVLSGRRADTDGQASAPGAARLCPADQPAEVVLDFGRVIVGTLAVRVRAEAPTRLELYYGEALQEALRDTEYEVHWYKRPRDLLDVPAAETVLTNYGRRAFRYVRLVAPAGAAPVTVTSVQATLRHYPVDEAAGAFACSDPRLNRIWDLCAYTTKLCMQQYYEDGIKRDGLLWVSDYRVQYLCNALLFGDRDLARKSLFLMAASQIPETGAIPAQASRGGASQHPQNIEYMPGIPRGVHSWVLVNYSLDYVGCLRDYYLHTADRDAIVALWPSVQKLLPFLRQQDPAQLLPLKNFITDSRYKESWWGSHGVLEMQFVIGLEDALYLAGVVGDEAARAECEAWLARQRARLPAYFDRERGFYLDEPGRRESTSAHVNAFSHLAGAADYRALAGALARSPVPVRPAASGFMLFWTQEAMFRAGLAAEALQEIRNVYGHMLQFGATTTWEKCDLSVGDHPDENECAGSRCHGWTAGPAYFLPAHVLGVQPAEPGFAAVRVEPHLCDLRWAEGAVPTPRGPIRARWEQGATLKGTVVLPEGIAGQAGMGGRTIQLTAGVNRLE